MLVKFSPLETTDEIAENVPFGNLPLHSCTLEVYIPENVFFFLADSPALHQRCGSWLMERLGFHH